MQRGALPDGTYTVLAAECKRSARGGDLPLAAWSRLVQRHGGVEVGETASGVAAALRSAAEAGWGGVAGPGGHQKGAQPAPRGPAAGGPRADRAHGAGGPAGPPPPGGG